MYSTDFLKSMLSPEQLFVVLLARLYFKTGDRSEAGHVLAENGFDHTSLEKIISVHGIRPFVFDTITAHHIEAGASLIARLKSYYLYNNRRSVEQLVIAGGIVADLQRQGIDVIPFKGAGFAHNYYGNLSVRESSDIDLFAHEKDVERVEQSFIAKGFEAKVTVPPQYMAYYKTWFKEIVYSASMHPGSASYSVELHWKFLDIFFGNYPGYDFFSKGVVSQQINDVSFKRFTPTYELLAVVSNHFVKDMSLKFKYLLDVAALISRCGNEIDVQLFTSTIEKYRCRKRVEHGLFIVAHLLGVRLEGYRFAYSFKTSAIKKPLQVPLYIRHFEVTNPSFVGTALRLQDNPRSKLKFLQRCMFYYALPTTNDINKAPHKNRSIRFLALLRPFRLAGKAWALWREKNARTSRLRN